MQDRARKGEAPCSSCMFARIDALVWACSTHVLEQLQLLNKERPWMMSLVLHPMANQFHARELTSSVGGEGCERKDSTLSAMVPLTKLNGGDKAALSFPLIQPAAIIDACIDAFTSWCFGKQAAPAITCHTNSLTFCVRLTPSANSETRSS